VEYSGKMAFVDGGGGGKWGWGEKDLEGGAPARRHKQLSLEKLKPCFRRNPACGKRPRTRENKFEIRKKISSSVAKGKGPPKKGDERRRGSLIGKTGRGRKTHQTKLSAVKERKKLSNLGQ